MYEVKETNKRISDGTGITTYTRQVCLANILEVEAGTTGYCGGDSGHGGRTFFRIQDLGGTDIRPEMLMDDRGYTNGFEVVLGGDSELDTAIEALEFIIDVLRDQISSNRGIPEQPATDPHRMGFAEWLAAASITDRRGAKQETERANRRQQMARAIIDQVQDPAEEKDYQAMLKCFAGSCYEDEFKSSWQDYLNYMGE